MIILFNLLEDKYLPYALSFLVVFWISTVFQNPVFAAHYPDSYYESLQKRINDAVDDENKKKSDFLISRYIGASFMDSETKKGLADLQGIIRKRGLSPFSFLSSEYDKEFIDWFVKSSYINWGVDEEHVREKSGAYEIRSVTYGKYFLTVTATPELQAWYVEGEDSTPLIVTAGSSRVKTLIYSGKIINGTPLIYFPLVDLDIGKRRLLYMWKPEFYDLNGDGIPEIWIRCNLTSSNGYIQMLAIYRIEEDNRLKLVKKFVGDYEGVARRMEDGTIQVGRGAASNATIPHMSFDQYRLESWKYEGGDFKKVSEELIPHILKTKAWKGYFLDADEPWMKKYAENRPSNSRF